MAGHNFISKDNIDNRNVSSELDRINIKTYLISILHKSTAVPFRRHGIQYQCFYCDDIFSLSSKLKEHTNQKHGRIDPNDSLRFWTQFKLASNLMLDIQDMECKICHTRIFDLKDLLIHLREKHNETIPKEVLSYIICFILSDGVIKCYWCKKGFEYFGDLIHHMKSRSHVICKTCGEGFICKQRFAEHESTNCKPCRPCNIRFKSKKHRDEHLKVVHCRNLKCDFCSQEFMFKMTLARHIKNIHYKEKNGRCEFCGKTFFNTHYLNMHRISHGNVKFYECDVCKKKFMKNQTMKLHKRIHDNDRRYVCKICGKTFIQWVSLDKHKLVHTDERNFQCSECGQCFKDKRTLLKHFKRIHQRENKDNQ